MAGTACMRRRRGKKTVQVNRWKLFASFTELEVQSLGSLSGNPWVGIPSETEVGVGAEMVPPQVGIGTWAGWRRV